MSVCNFLILIFTPLVAADSGDDFSNNLFSDLGPLLALFGEKPTMQFMSQSIGWADNIILAMAPLGIVTAIVAAIRVGGPSWLRAIIGRAMESRAAVEVELMSSTSNEVCELWNGQDVVRVTGQGPIREFIIMMPQGSGEIGANESKLEAQRQTKSENETNLIDSGSTDKSIGQRVSVLELDDSKNTYFTKHKPTFRERVFGTYIEKRRDPESAVLTHDTHQCDSSSSKAQQDGITERENEPDGPIIIVRNTVDTAPNLTFNIHNGLGRVEVYLVAMIGITLQSGFLIYCGFVTYYPTLMFFKDGDPVANYAFPCMAAGTLALVVGLLICAHVVENSTSETTYRSAAGKEARIVWLQKSETVNDQAFESFAVFPQAAQSIVTTSQRADKQMTETMTGQESTEILTSKPEELKAVIGTVISICGYIVQFVGLRGMHWSASLALLIAIGIMAGLRALIRRNLAKIPRAQPLLSGHEMDWLAMTLGGDFKKAPWLFPSQVNVDKSARPWAEGDEGWDWRVDPTVCEKLREAEKLNSKTEEADSDSKPYKVMKIRRNLSKLADWHGPASAEAISLARAIEITMDALFAKTPAQDLTWSISVSGDPIKFRLTREENGGWKAYADELESALSLWLYSVRKREQGIEQDYGSRKSSGEDDATRKDSGVRHRKRNTDDDAWLRAKGTPAKRSLRILDCSTQRLQQDLRWWMPSGAVRVLELEEYTSAGDTGTIVVESHRVVGHQSNPGSSPREETQTRQFGVAKSLESPGENSPQREAGGDETPGTLLASESYETLETLFAQHLFSVFMWSAAKTVDEVVAGGAIVRPMELEGESDDLAWRSFTLHNTKLSKLAQDIENTGLGSLEEIYMSIIPPLSSVKKLPGSEAIVEWTRKHAQPHAQLGHWREVGDAYLWLFEISRNFPVQVGTHTKVTALLLEYLRTVSDTATLKKAQLSDEKLVEELEIIQSSLRKASKSMDLTTLKYLKGVYEVQSWCSTSDVLKPSTGIKTEDSMLRLTGLHRSAREDAGSEIAQWMATAKHTDANVKDILDWTPLHHAAATGSLGASKQLLKLKSGADVNARDVCGRAPLHLAAKGGYLAIVGALISAKADVNAQDDEGLMPLHYAARSGRTEVVQELGSFASKANENEEEEDGPMPIHLAAGNGHKETVEILLDLDTGKDLRDDNLLTPLHYAAMKGRVKTVKALFVSLPAKLRAVEDKNGRTPLHLAAGNGHTRVIRAFHKSEVHLNPSDKLGRTPLHLAAMLGHPKVVKLLIELGANKEVQDASNRTPLQLATVAGHRMVVEILVKLAADLEARDKIGQTALHLTAKSGRRRFSEVLITLGANVEAQDVSGRTPLHLATMGGYSKVIKLLIKLGAAVDARDTQGRTSLHVAAMHGNLKAVQVLLDLGASKTAEDKEGLTAEALAEREKQDHVLAMLSPLGPPKRLDSHFPTALHLAALHGDASKVKALVESGADKTVRNKFGRVPLHYAAWFGHIEVVKMFVEEFGVDVNITTDHGWTPLHHASHMQYAELVKVLIDLGANRNARNARGQKPSDLSDLMETEASIL